MQDKIEALQVRIEGAISAARDYLAGNWKPMLAGFIAGVLVAL